MASAGDMDVTSEAMRNPEGQGPGVQDLRLDPAALYRAEQARWWEERAEGSNKRPPPTPGSSAFTSPGLPGQRDHTAAAPGPSGAGQHSVATTPPMDLLPRFADDGVAMIQLAASMGVDTNNQEAMQNFLLAPINNMSMLFHALRHYHTAVIRPEMVTTVHRLEAALTLIGDHVLKQRAELSWLATECRQHQKERSSVQCLLGGWPKNTPPAAWDDFVIWMLHQVKETKEFATLYHGMTSDKEDDPNILTCLMSPPVTIKMGESWGNLTILTFKTFQLRQSFMARYGTANTPLWLNNAPVAGSHIRVTPGVPPYQRKLEGVVRVLLGAWNEHPDHHNAKFTVLWKSLTIMMPQTTKDYDPEHLVAAKVEFPTTPLGNMKCLIVLTDSMSTKLQFVPDGQTENLWEISWNRQWWGRQLEEDDLDKAAAEKVSTSPTTPQKGKGKSRNKVQDHWTKGFTTTTFYSPFQLDVEFQAAADPIDFDKREYNSKMGRPDLNRTGTAGPTTPQQGSEAQSSAWNPGKAGGKGTTPSH